MELRAVRVTGVGLLCSAGIGLQGASGGQPGDVPAFRARDWISDRKSLKLMTRSVQLGLAAVSMALADDGSWMNVPPERRGMFVGASPQPGDPGDLRPALEAGMDEDDRFSLTRFARDGIPRIHPLWLLRGLSNNVLGFASLFHDLQGVNRSYCDGSDGGWCALTEGARAVAEGRADLVVAGGADALVAASPVLRRSCGNGAAFLVLRAGRSGTGRGMGLRLAENPSPCPADLDLDADEDHLGYLGAATWPVSLARHLVRQGLVTGT
jgi:hypothetical protein